MIIFVALLHLITKVCERSLQCMAAVIIAEIGKVSFEDFVVQYSAAFHQKLSLGKKLSTVSQDFTQLCVTCQLPAHKAVVDGRRL